MRFSAAIAATMQTFAAYINILKSIDPPSKAIFGLAIYNNTILNASYIFAVTAKRKALANGRSSTTASGRPCSAEGL
jgi:hypothetical protein